MAGNRDGASVAVRDRAADQRERVPVAEGVEPAVAEVPARPLTLAQRMAAIRAEADGIGKEDIPMEKDGKKWKIKGHTVEAVLSEMRPLFVKHSVHFVPQLVSRTHSGNRCDVEVAFEFEDLDTGEAKIIRWGGSGTDNGDKAFAKAGTNALKEMLKKVFLITDRDDAKEEEEKVEHQTDEAVKRSQVERVEQTARATQNAWAKAFKMAVEGVSTVKELNLLYRESGEELERLPAVTRDFFAELRVTRKASLEASEAMEDVVEEEDPR